MARASRPLALALAFACAAVAGCGGDDELKAALERASSEAAAERPRRVVEVRRLTGFAWDRAYVFVAYSDEAAIDDALGFQSRVRRKAPDARGDNLIVFVRGSEVVRYVENLDGLEMHCLTDVEPWTPATFRFVVRRVEGSRSALLTKEAPASAGRRSTRGCRVGDRRERRRPYVPRPFRRPT